jgi:uncharacterized repeat protein (TIGR01451 family)
MKLRQICLPLLGLFLGVGCGGSVPGGPQGRSRDIVMLQGTLLMSVSNTGPAQVGLPQTFTTVITNPTAAAIDNVFGSVSVYTFNGTASSAKTSQGSCPRNGPPDFICFFGTVAPGATITVTTVVVPTDAGSLSFASNAGPMNDDTADLTTIDIAPSPTDVQVGGFASNGSPPRGGDFTYTFQVKNNGPFTADAVAFTDTLPAVLPVGSVTVSLALPLSAPASSATCAVSGQTVSCDLGTMPVGSQATIVIGTTAPVAPQSITNTASIASATPDRNPANGSASVTVQIK